MKTKVLDYIDFEKVNTLLEGFNKSTGFVTAILDLEGNVLSKSGWRQICTEFHRINPETAKKCTVSDTVLANKMSKGEKYHFYKCLNGLVDVAVPIVINGKHIANLFSGQFFFDEPDHDFFKKHAKMYGFNEQNYLKALESVPIVSKEKVKIAMDFLLNMTQLISEITLQKLEQSQLNEALRKSEELSRSALDNILEGCQIIGFDWKFIYLNRTAEIHNRRPNDEMIGNRYMDMWPGIEKTGVFKIIKQTLENKVSNHFENEFLFPDGSLGWFDLSIQPVPEGVFILSIDITERKLKEGQLFESEFKFSRLYENGPFGMVMVDKEFRFKKANPAFCAVLGYSDSELRKLSFIDLSHPDDLKKNLLNAHKLLKKEISVYKTEKRYIRKDGHVIWGSLTVTATYDSDGQFLYFLGIIEDITRRKHAEEEVRKSNENFAKAFYFNPLSLTITTVKDGQFIMINEAFTRDLGYTADEIIGKTIGEFNIYFNPEDRLSLLKTFYDKGNINNLEMHFRAKSGKIILVELSMVSVQINGKDSILSAFHNISERKIIEDELKASEKRLSKIFHLGPVAKVLTRNSDSIIIDFNTAAEKLFGYKHEDVMGKTVDSFDFWMDSTERLRITEKFRKQGFLQGIEFQYKTTTGKRGWASIFTESFEIKGEKYLLNEFIEITDRKLAKENIQKLNEELEQRILERTAQLEATNKELESFSYSVSHDLRSPLRHINGFAEILIKQYSDRLPEDARKYLNTITGSANKMGTLIDDLLSFSRTGRAELKKSALNMNQVIEDALVQIKPFLVNRKIDWKILPLPEVNGDYNLLRMVWINLLDNAVKYTRTKENAIIQIGYKDEKIETVFFIKDNGVGFDMKYADKLFGVFQRLHSSSQFDGTGIGLANVQRIILRHGGRTWAKAETDKGASFYFSIPKEMEDIL